MEAVVFDDWKGGEFGLLSARDAGKAQDSMFAGKNVMRYRDGLLGPRPGVRNLGVTGLGNGKIKSIGTGNAGVVVVIGSTVYSFDPTSYGGAATAWTMTDSITDTLLRPAEMLGVFADEYVLCYDTGNVYKLHNATTTCAKVASGGTNMPAGRCATFYQDRIIIGGTSSAPQRLYFSDPGFAGWGTFPATSYYDLPGLAITFMVPFRSGLLVGTAGGAFVYITGTLGSDATVRTLSTQASPPDTPKAVKLDTDEILFMGLFRPYPSRYNGAVHESDKHLRWAGDNFALDSSETPTFRALKLIGPDDWMLLSGRAVAGAQNRALMHYESTASYHTWGVDIGAWGYDLGGGRTLLAKDGDGSHPPVFYILNTELFRPGFTVDADARPGDDSTTPLDGYAHLPQHWDPEGHELQAREVIVDFRKWDTGSGANNHFDVTMRAVSRYSQADVRTDGPQTFDEAGSSASTAGVDDRRSFYFGDQGYGGGFEVYVDNIKGVAIRSVTVLYDRQPPR